MNLINLHSSDKPVQTQVLFEPTENKVIALQIAKNEQLKEHVTKVPALLICVTGEAIFSNEKGEKIHLKSGDFIHVFPQTPLSVFLADFYRHDCRQFGHCVPADHGREPPVRRHFFRESRRH